MDASQHLIQILLPVTGNEGTPFGAEPYAITRQELTDTFGGLTAYLRAPARGVWKQDDGDEARDDIVIFEVMSDSLDAAWWRTYRRRLEERFRQDVIVIRAMPATIL